MPGGKGGSGGRQGSGNMKGARSLGAAAGPAKPNGAILDDTAEVLLQQKQRFKAWAKDYRDSKLKENPWTKMYQNSPNPIKGT